MSRRSLVIAALVVAHAQAASTLKMMDEAGREARITWKDDVLTVPQHCRESTCSSMTQRQDALERRLTSLETAQVSTLGLVQDLVAALSQHKGEAATDAELKAAINSTGLYDAVLERQRTGRPILGLHVRHGDACGKDAQRSGRHCEPLSAYIAAAKRLTASAWEVSHL